MAKVQMQPQGTWKEVRVIGPATGVNETPLFDELMYGTPPTINDTDYMIVEFSDGSRAAYRSDEISY